jgi:hypothetical protein
VCVHVVNVFGNKNTQVQNVMRSCGYNTLIHTHTQQVNTRKSNSDAPKKNANANTKVYNTVNLKKDMHTNGTK